MKLLHNTILATLVAILVSVLAAAGQPRIAGAQVATLQLTSQTPFVAADGSLDIEMQWTGSFDTDVTISSTIWAPMSNESDIFVEPGVVLNRVAQRPLAELSRTSDGVFSYSIPIRSFVSPGDDRKFLENPGVYPVTIELRDQNGELARLRTNLIRLETDVTDIPLLPLSIILSVSSADGLVLSDAIHLLSAHPTLPMMVLLEDGLLPQLQSNQELAADFAAALGDRTLVAGTQLDLDPSALASIDQGQLYERALSDTRQRFLEIGLVLEPTILPLGTGITRAGATFLTSAGIQIVLDTHTATGSGGSITGDVTGLRVVQVDADHTAGLITGRSVLGGGGAVQRAHRLLAQLAVRYETDRSPVILGGGELRNVDLDALEVLLNSLDTGGMIEARSLSLAAESARLLPFRYQENSDQNLTSASDPIDNIQRLARTYAGFRVAGGPSPEGIEIRLVEGLSRDLNPDARSRAIAAIERDLTEEFRVISLPEGPAITLAAQTSAIPLTVTNTSSGVRRIRLQFESDRIGVAEHDQEFLIQPGKSQIALNIEARSLGVSSLLVTVLTPDGTHQLATTRFEIRSTAIPGLGYALSGTALVFLVIWWIRSIRRARADKANNKDELATSKPTDRDTTLSS